MQPAPGQWMQTAAFGMEARKQERDDRHQAALDAELAAKRTAPTEGIEKKDAP